MKKASGIFFAFLFFAASAWAVSPAREGNFTFKNLEVHHQGVNVLNITISFRFKKQTPEAAINTFYKTGVPVLNILKNYPNTADWWEIVNKALTQKIMDENRDIDSLASDIEVNWTSGAGVEYGHRYPTRCVTARTAGGRLYEYFGFRTWPDYTLKTADGKSVAVHLDVLYRYKENIANTEYPDGLAAENTFKNAASSAASALKTDSPQSIWPAVAEKAGRELLAANEPITGVTAMISYTAADGSTADCKISLNK